MSCDFGIWFPHERLSHQQAGELYVRLCEGDISGVVASPAIDALYAELTVKHPEIDDIPEEEIDNTDLCPWSIAFDRSPGHLIISCVWSKAEYVHDLLVSLARQHGLALYNPQDEVIHYHDDDGSTKKRPWLKFW